jgi:alpha-beta hydrolase superfamily lysophospholipase
VADATMTIGRVQVHRWPATDAARLIVLVHGYGEHMARYEHLAQAFVTRGSAVVGPDHIGHGLTPSERAIVEDFEAVVDDHLEAYVAADRAIAEGPGFGDLPLLYLHGGDDQLPPVALARPVVERMAGPDSELRIVEGARHELFDELSKAQTIESVASFAERVTSS